MHTRKVLSFKAALFLYMTINKIKPPATLPVIGALIHNTLLKQHL